MTRSLRWNAITVLCAAVTAMGQPAVRAYVGTYSVECTVSVYAGTISWFLPRTVQEGESLVLTPLVSPNGNTSGERDRNEKTLRGFQAGLLSGGHRLDQSRIKWHVVRPPPNKQFCSIEDASGRVVTSSVEAATGGVGSFTKLRLRFERSDRKSRPSVPVFRCPAVALWKEPIRILGTFDPDREPPELRIKDLPMKVVAQTENQILALMPGADRDQAIMTADEASRARLGTTKLTLSTGNAKTTFSLRVISLWWEEFVMSGNRANAALFIFGLRNLTNTIEITCFTPVLE